MSSRVLFIAGWGRSGSTLLDRMLGQMSGVISVGEMRDVWERGVVEDRLCGCGVPFSECTLWSKVGEDAFGGWDALDVERMSALRRRLDRPWVFPGLLLPRLLPRSYRDDLREYASALAALYESLGHVSGAEVIVDSSKIPSYALILRAAGVDLRVLHLVRDSRGVIHSWRKQVLRPDATADPDYMLRYGVGTGSARYVLYNAMTHLLQARLPYRRLRYEDVASSPVPSLHEIATHAGLELDPPVLQSLQDGTLEMTPNHTVDGNPMRFKVGALRVRLDEAWRRDLGRAPRLLVTLLTAPLLLKYGYLRSPKGAPLTERSAR